MSLIRRPGSRRPRQTSRRENRHINYMKAPSRRTFEIAELITCAALDTHPSTPLFGVVPRTRKLNCSGMEPGQP
ncbi:hypothetical protein TNCV_265321 [Trichonephila clavipes]|nr:hypothetical protein TNCV_265321 [Trichonephila clavipes]